MGWICLHLLVQMFAQNHTSLVCWCTKCALNLQHSWWHVLKSQCKASLKLEALYKMLSYSYCTFCDTHFCCKSLPPHVPLKLNFGSGALVLGDLKCERRIGDFNLQNGLIPRKNMHVLDKPWKTLFLFLT